MSNLIRCFAQGRWTITGNALTRAKAHGGRDQLSTLAAAAVLGMLDVKYTIALATQVFGVTHTEVLAGLDRLGVPRRTRRVSPCPECAAREAEAAAVTAYLGDAGLDPAPAQPDASPEQVILEIMADAESVDA